MPLLSDAEAASIRDALSVLLVHTFTRVPVTSTEEDTGYGRGEIEGTPVSGLPCAYQAETRVRLTRGDRMLVNVPTLTVPHDDATKNGDLARDITDSEGAVLLAGPIRVYAVQADAGLGPTLQKTLVLEGGDVI